MKSTLQIKENSDNIRVTSIEIWDGTSNFDSYTYLKQYEDAYKYWLEKAKESGYLFNVQHSSPVFMLPIVYYDTEWKKWQIDVILKTWISWKFLDKDILDNIRNSGNIDLLDISYDVRSPHFEEIEIQRKIYEFFQNNARYRNALIDNYCNAQQQTLDFYTSKKEQLTILKASWRMILDDIDCPLTENRWLISPESIKNIMHATASYSWKTFIDIEKYEADIFDVLQISKDREYMKIDELLVNLRDVDVMIENMESQKKIFQNEIIKKIQWFDKDRDGILEIDSRYLFFENGNGIYEEILLKSKYSDYYFWECENLEENFDAIKQYCNPFFIDLWCGAGSKDEILMRKYAEYRIPLSKAIFMDGSLSALISCYSKFKKNKTHDGRYNFSTDWIDQLKPTEESDSGRWMHVCHDPNVPSDNEMIINRNTLGEQPSTFSMRGWTLWCFGEYKKEFLKTIGTVMKAWDNFLVSVFRKPEAQKDIDEIISKYDNKESKRFVLNFLQKIWISKNHMKYSVEYENNKIQIFVTVDNPIWLWVEISAFGERAHIKNGVKIKIHESQRFDTDDFDALLKESDCLLHLDAVVENPYGWPVVYVLKK